MKGIKLIKLVNGDEIVGIVDHDQYVVTIKNPMILDFDNEDNYLQPYISSTKDNTITILYHSIITIVNPVDELTLMWNHTIQLNSVLD